MRKTQHILYPFTLESSQGGMAAAARLTGNSPLHDECTDLVFRSVDTHEFKIGTADVQPVEITSDALPFDVWFGVDFPQQHLQAYTRQLPKDIAQEIYRDPTIAKPGTIEYLNEFLTKYPADESKDEIHSGRYRKVLNDISEGDTVAVQGPVWFTPFIRDNSEAIKAKGAKLVLFEHQLIPENLDKTLLGKKLLPCYQRADEIYFHTSVYADRLSDMLEGPLPVMKTVNLGIDVEWIDRVQEEVQTPEDIGFATLTPKQQELVTTCFKNRDTVQHKFICFDRMDAMKGIHAVINGIKLFLDEARESEGSGYAKKYHFACIHELLDIKNYKEFKCMDQYIRVCKEMYAELQAEHPGVISLSQSFTNKNRHRDILPTLIRGRTVLALHGQDGLGLSALEGAYINRHQNTGLIIGNQSGAFLEAKKRGFDSLINGVPAGDSRAIAEAIRATVLLRERGGNTLSERNAIFAEKFVIPRKDSMMVK